MNSKGFLEYTKHTPLCESVRQKIASAYRKAQKEVTLYHELSKDDFDVLVEIGYLQMTEK